MLICFRLPFLLPPLNAIMVFILRQRWTLFVFMWFLAVAWCLHHRLYTIAAALSHSGYAHSHQWLFFLRKEISYPKKFILARWLSCERIFPNFFVWRIWLQLSWFFAVNWALNENAQKYKTQKWYATHIISYQWPHTVRTMCVNVYFIPQKRAQPTSKDGSRSNGPKHEIHAKRPAECNSQLYIFDG